MAQRDLLEGWDIAPTQQIRRGKDEAATAVSSPGETGLAESLGFQGRWAAPTDMAAGRTAWQPHCASDTTKQCCALGLSGCR